MKVKILLNTQVNADPVVATGYLRGIDEKYITVGVRMKHGEPEKWILFSTEGVHIVKEKGKTVEFPGITLHPDSLKEIAALVGDTPDECSCPKCMLQRQASESRQDAPEESWEEIDRQNGFTCKCKRPTCPLCFPRWETPV